jgi:hypothetical protein
MASVSVDSAWNRGKLMALARYRKLQLDTGANCIYLRRRATNWDAKIAVPSEKGCPRSAGDRAPSLPVLAGHERAIDSVPNAARIIEGRNHEPFIGVRCGAEWCVIGARSRIELTEAAHAHAFGLPHAPPATTRARLDAWFDDQTLAVADPATKVLRAGFRASIVPDTGLLHRASAQYTSGFVPVSAIYAADVPPEKYAKRFGYTKGWNLVFMHREGSLWTALILDGNDKMHLRMITNYPHTIGDAPGSARWDWWDSDEWVWAPCDAGCCLVQEGDDGK